MSRTRILLDGRIIAYRKGGIPRYVQSLASAIAGTDTPFDLALLVNRRVASPLPLARVYTPPHHRWERTTLGLEVLRFRPALLHSADFVPPRTPRKIRRIVTVHDLAFLDYPDLVAPEAGRYYGQIRQALLDVDGVIAVSRWTAQRLSHHVPRLSCPVRVIYNGIDHAFLSSRPTYTRCLLTRALGEPAMAALNRQGFLLAVGTVEPRKRYLFLLDVLDVLWERYGERAPMLVIVGQAGWRCERELERLAQARARGRALWVDDADDETLLALYTQALLLVIPSLDEGFCLPAAEGMAAGLPVVAARRGALPEVLGQAGLLLDTDSPSVWADAIVRLVEDAEMRRQLAERGRQRAQQFSWAETARQTLAFYEEVLAR